ncbi:MAG: leucine-rich repeat domain-containing protein [Treponema sp.]|nr:leucine-rich repeat domain-containing protein [Treponema sp.]
MNRDSRYTIQIDVSPVTREVLGTFDFSGGKYEFTIRNKKDSLLLRVNYIVNAPSYEEAKAMVINSARQKWKVDVASVEILFGEIVQQPKNATAGENAQKIAEDVFETISASTEMAGIVLELRKLKAIADKLGGSAGKAFTGLDIANDFIKAINLIDEQSKIKDDRIKREYSAEIFKLFAKMTKTAVVAAIPYASWVDLGVTAIYKVTTSISQMKIDAKLQSKKDEYDNHKYALYEHEAWYEEEWRLYASGISMDDIVELRRAQWKRYWDPSGVKKITYSNPASDTGVYHNLTEHPIVERGKKPVKGEPVVVDKGLEFNKNTLTITKFKLANDKNVTIPEKIDGKTVEIIGAKAFENCGIESLTLPKNIKRIEANAFQNCKSLKTVTLLNASTIGDSVFAGCGQLTTVNPPSGTSNMTIGNNAFNGTKLNETTKKALRKLGYTGAGVGKGFVVQNSTGAGIEVIEVKTGSGWSSVLAKSVKNGSNTEVSLAPGTYDLRVRTRTYSIAGDTFEKKAVKVTDDTTVNFTTGDKYKLTRAEYQAFIQARCRFSNQADVWKVMDTHSSPDDLYRVWAQSYPDTSDHIYPYPRSGASSKEADQKIIQDQCKFGNAKAVWDAVAKHKNANDLLRVWANSYYKK